MPKPTNSGVAQARKSTFLAALLLSAACSGATIASSCPELAEDVAGLVIEAADAFAQEIVASAEESEATPDIAQDDPHPVAIATSLATGTDAEDRTRERAEEIQQAATALGCQDDFAQDVVRQRLTEELEAQVLAASEPIEGEDHVAGNIIAILLVLMDGVDASGP